MERIINQTVLRPFTATEEKLAQIWCQVLDLDKVTLDQTFFDLGGDSLGVMLAISRMKNAFGLMFEIEDFLFEDATIWYFSIAIDEAHERSIQP